MKTKKNSEKDVFFEKSNKPTLSKSDSERENRSAVIGNAMDITATIMEKTEKN